MLKCKTIRDLLKGQFEQRFTCRDIINTYSKRSYTIGRGLELTADEMFNTALEEADERDKELQEWLKRKGDPYKELGKLHGKRNKTFLDYISLFILKFMKLLALCA